MSYCLNPHCPHPQNPPRAKFCQTCGSALVLQGMYRAIALLGQGGFGRTFRAIHHGRFDQPCVIKQLWVTDQSPSTQAKAIALFRGEARRLFDLGQHPQIPALIAHLEVGQQMYLVQDLVEGRTLTEELHRQGAFTVTQVDQVLRDILPVLTFIHGRGVIHRDIKPDNLIHPPNGPLALVDFGAAKAGSFAHLSGTIIGSAGYAAPEQAIGRATVASDLYSLGATCIHLLTGLPPTLLFDGPGNRFNWVSALQGRGVGGPLRSILDRLLMPDQRDRYPSAAAVLQDLNPSQGAPATAPTGRHEPPRRSGPLLQSSPGSGHGLYSLDCVLCQGTGLVMDDPQPCLACAGSGQQWDIGLNEGVCSLCGGSGVWRMSRVCGGCGHR